MCGIFGTIIRGKDLITYNEFYKLSNKLFKYSSTRGKEAAGLALSTKNSIDIFKDSCSPQDFIKNENYKKILKDNFNKFSNNSIKSLESKDFPITLIGHSRLVTNGLQSQSYNNQPVILNELIGIHNGIITNEKEIWENHHEIKREYEVDTEAILKLLSKNLKLSRSFKKSTIDTFKEIKGSASIASLFRDYESLLLATNTGSIFYVYSSDKNIFIFASERFILQKILKSQTSKYLKKNMPIQQLKANEAIIFDLNNMNLKTFKLNSKSSEKINKSLICTNSRKITNYTKNFRNIKRCKRCILPISYPYMELDSNDICRYCRRHKKFTVEGEKKLFEIVEKYRSKDNSPDCIVALSGGRDSCYGLHYIKKVLGLNPIAFTYDWGLVTDLARRNAARICGELGVEHIIRTPNISKKRKYVKKNIEAWLKKPELGMIPLFMAGDKAFYYFARKLRKETNLKLVFFCTGNMMENTPFKFGFSGLKDGESGNTLTKIKLLDKLKLLAYYTKNFIVNPYYLNDSILDTALAYWHTFIEKDDFLYLYKYIHWDESKIVNTIINQYGWEISRDTKTTWRIGDGTAAFYNYIYSTIAGFSEDDDMLSNMIREKYITRDEALNRSNEFSKPRIESITEFAQMIGLNLDETLNIINKVKKKY